MNRKQFAILVVLLIVLGGAGWYVQMKRNLAGSAGGNGTGQKLLGESFPVNDVTHISIKQGAKEVNLVKKDDLWRVRERNDYPANFSEISEFLLKARDLKVIQSEEVGASQLPRLQLALNGLETNSGVLLDLKNKDEKSLQTLTLGKKHMRKPAAQQQSMQFGNEAFPDGRYVMSAGNTKNALLISDPLDSIQPEPEPWLNKDFFKVERPKAIAVTFPEATNSWKLVRDTESGDWKFDQAKPDEKLDSAKVSPLSNPFAAPSFIDVILPGSFAYDTSLDNNPTVVTINTFDDLTYTVKIGKEKLDKTGGQDYPISVAVTADFPKERVPAKEEKPEDKTKADKAWADRQKQLDEKLKRDQAYANWTYLVPGWNVDPLLKVRKDLLVEKKDESKPAGTAAPTTQNNIESAPAATAQKK